MPLLGIRGFRDLNFLEMSYSLNSFKGVVLEIIWGSIAGSLDYGSYRALHSAAELSLETDRSL